MNLKQDMQQLRDVLRQDIQQLMDNQTMAIERLVKGQPSPRAKLLTVPGKKPQDSLRKGDENRAKEHPMSVPPNPTIDEDFALEDTEVLTDVVPAMKLQLSPLKDGGWVGTSGSEPYGAAASDASSPRSRQSMFQRFKTGVHDFMSTDGEKEQAVPKAQKDQKGAKLRRMKMPVLYAHDEHAEDVKLDEEAYDVMNFYKQHGIAQKLARSDIFERVTLGVICINAIYIGVDADKNTAATLIDSTWPYQLCDHLFCIYFVFELAVRFAAFESKRNCLRDVWFIFDAVLVAMMVFETWLLSIILLIAGGGGGSLQTGPLRLLRLLRLSRLVRLLRSLPELLTLVNGMRAASRAVTSALMLIIGLNYGFAIIINMFLSDITESENIVAKFSTLGLSMWSLALHGTFADGIADIMEDIRALETLGYDWVLGWSMISVFFLYVLLTNITVMNMLIGIVCEVVAEVKQRDEKNSAVDYLKRNLRELLIELDNDQNGQISKEELQSARQMPMAKDVLKELGVDLEDLLVLTEPLFEQDFDEGREQEVTREELLNIILDMRGDRDVRMEDIVRMRCDMRRYLSRQFQQLGGQYDGEGE